jgi:hypothetical protein
LPWGYVITVVQLPSAIIEQGQAGTHSWWDVDTRTIALAREYTLAEKRGLLVHELDHAYTDWKLWLAQCVGIAPVPDAAPIDPDESDEESD